MSGAEVIETVEFDMPWRLAAADDRNDALQQGSAVMIGQAQQAGYGADIDAEDFGGFVLTDPGACAVRRERPSFPLHRSGSNRNLPVPGRVPRRCR